MKKILFTIFILVGIGFVIAQMTSSWKLFLDLPEEQFQVDPENKEEGWTISSRVDSISVYPEWSTMKGNGRNISGQTVGMWLDLSTVTEPVTIYTFGDEAHLCGLQLVYEGNGILRSKRTGEPGQAFAIGQETVNKGWFNLAMALDTDIVSQKTDFRIFLNGRKIAETLQLPSSLQGPQNGNVSVGEGTSEKNSFKIAKFQAFNTVLSDDEIRGVWMVVPQPSTAALGLVGMAVLMVRRIRS